MLILLSELAQGHGPDLYLAPDNYLVSQGTRRSGPRCCPALSKMNNAATASPAHAPMLGVGVPREVACCSSGAVSWA